MRATRIEWQRRVKAWKASGLSAAAFAKKSGVNSSTLKWWSSNLRRDAASAPKFIEVALPTPKPTTDGRVEVVVGGLMVRVSGAFDPGVLRAVVAALGGR